MASCNVWNCIISHQTEKNLHKNSWLRWFFYIAHSFSITHTKLFVVFHWLMCYANISRDFHSIAFRNFRFNFFYHRIYCTTRLILHKRWRKKQSSTIETHDWIKVFHMKPTIEFYCMWNYRRNSIEYSGLGIFFT